MVNRTDRLIWVSFLIVGPGLAAALLLLLGIFGRLLPPGW